MIRPVDLKDFNQVLEIPPRFAIQKEAFPTVLIEIVRTRVIFRTDEENFHIPLHGTVQGDKELLVELPFCA